MEEDIARQLSIFAMIPTVILFDKRITPNAKLLYAEISSLTRACGFCWATNRFFAERHDVSTIAIGKWIAQLEKYGYLKREVIFYPGTKRVKERRLYILLNGECMQENVQKVFYPPNKSYRGYQTNVREGIKQKLEDNNINIINNNNSYGDTKRKKKNSFNNCRERKNNDALDKLEESLLKK